jgi:hypothetical protein
MDAIDSMFGVHPACAKSFGESLVTSSITAKVDTTTLSMTMRFASRAGSRDVALAKTGPRRRPWKPAWPDGVAVSYDRLDKMLASAGSRK